MTILNRKKFKKTLSNASNKSLELSARMGNQKHLSVLRDAFGFLIPIIIAGALAVLIRSFIFGGAGAGPATSILGWIAMGTGDAIKDTKGTWTFVSGTNIAQASHIGNFLFLAISHATIDVMSIYLAFGIGYFLSRLRNSKTPVIAGMVSLAAFMTSTLSKSDLLGAQGLLTAIIISILSTELFCLFEKSSKLEIKMPEGVPPAIAKSFAKLLPTIIILLIVCLINLPFVLFGVLTKTIPSFALWNDTATWTFGDAIFAGIQSPFLQLVGSSNVGLGLAFLYAFFVSLLWFFGLHGSNVLSGIFLPIYLALYAENVDGANHIFVRGTFAAFIWIGGAGATLGMIFSIWFFSKNKTEKEIAKLAIGPAIFNINEPIIFGIPLVLNIKYVIPFIFTTPILTITTFLGYKAFEISPITVLIPWTAPIGVGAILATAGDWKAFVLAIINLAIAFVIWVPWIILWTKKHISKEGKLISTKNVATNKQEIVAKTIKKIKKGDK